VISLNRVLLLSTVGSTCLLGCDRDSTPPGATASASAVAAPSAKPPEKPWFVGSWRAPLKVERYQIEQTKQEGKIQAWAEDAGDKATGPAELQLEIDEAGTVVGNVTGALGKLNASGVLDGEDLRVRLQPAEPLEPAEMFNGVLMAKKSNAGFAGELKASSGDSLTVRKASVALSKQDAASKNEAATKGR
jgi:hypothetical protein